MAGWILGAAEDDSAPTERIHKMQRLRRAGFAVAVVALCVLGMACSQAASEVGASEKADDTVTVALQSQDSPLSDFESALNLTALIDAEDYDNRLDAPVLRLYQAYFNRLPDLAGAKYWLGIRRDSHSLRQIAGYMAGGQEFADNYDDTTNAQYLGRVYQNVLDRPYDQAGYDYWLDLLDTGQLDRVGVVFFMAGGTEFISNFPFTNDSTLPPTTLPPTTLPPSTLPPITAPPTGERITAAAETEPVPNRGDAADDPAIWVDPANPERSTIIGADKKGGIGVYDLSGNELHYYSVGRVNNVDIRDNVSFGSESVSLVAGSEREDAKIVFFTVDPSDRGLDLVGEIQSGIGIYGLCMHQAADGALSVFVSDSSGSVEHWEVDTSEGSIVGNRVRTIRFDSTTEGCVADDDNGSIYIAEEDQGIWRYMVDAASGVEPRLIDTTTENDGEHLRADVEGLAIWKGEDGSGYLIASSQGNDTFVIYDRISNEFVGSFEIESGTFDQVSYTDGIEVTSIALGPAFPNGLFVAQDDSNGSSNQNFKLVDWGLIARSVIGSP